MADNRFHYQILRYIPDLNRMEPRNFGIVLQGNGQTKFKLNTRFAQKGFVDTEAFQIWRRFLQEELAEEDSEQLEIFRPAKGTDMFLNYLQKRIVGNFSISNPLKVEYRQNMEIEQVLEDLFSKLVSDAEEKESLAPTRPTGKFRASSEEKQFIKRGLKENAHIDLDAGTEQWISYRIYSNGGLHLIEKVEFNRDLRRTAGELNGLLRFVPTVSPKFLKGNKIHLIVDQHKKFSNQSDEEADKYRRDRDELMSRAADKNILTYDTSEKVETLVQQIDQELPIYN